jgi:hypothetical protein
MQIMTGLMFIGDGHRYQHNLSLSGGNKGVTFFLSGDTDDRGVLQIGKDSTEVIPIQNLMLR